MVEIDITARKQEIAGEDRVQLKENASNYNGIKNTAAARQKKWQKS